MKSRRQFVRLAGTGILAAGVSAVYAAPVEEPVEPRIPADGFGIGMAGFTFSQLSVKKTVEMGRGIINIPKFVKTLREIEYSGMCSLEFEKDMKDPLAGIAESIGYFKGVLAARK